MVVRLLIVVRNRLQHKRWLSNSALIHPSQPISGLGGRMRVFSIDMERYP